MFKSTAERLTVIVCVTAVVLAFIGSFVFIALRHADPATLLSMVATLVGLYNLYLLRDQGKTIGQIERQTNGQMSKMTDAVIASTGQIPTNSTPTKEA